MKYYFAWLGSKRATKRGVPEPGCLLDRAAQAKLPVPAGGILLDNFFQLVVEEAVVREENGQITAVSPAALHDLLFNMARFPQLDEAVVIRPIHEHQFGPGSPPLKLTQAGPLAVSLCEGWWQQNGRRDLLLMTLPQATVAGTAVSLPNADSDEIILPEGKLDLPRLGRWQRPDAGQPPHAQRLQMLLRGLRRTFGDTGWEVDWRDDGRICWLWELRQNRSFSTDTP